MPVVTYYVTISPRCHSGIVTYYVTTLARRGRMRCHIMGDKGFGGARERCGERRRGGGSGSTTKKDAAALMKIVGDLRRQIDRTERFDLFGFHVRDIGHVLQAARNSQRGFLCND